jgi:hypothetical protein
MSVRYDSWLSSSMHALSHTQQTGSVRSSMIMILKQRAARVLRCTLNFIKSVKPANAELTDALM